MSASLPPEARGSSQPEAGRGQITLALVAPALALRLGLRALLEAAAHIEILIEAASLAEVASTPQNYEVLVMAHGTDFIPALPAALNELPGVRILFLVEDDLEPDHVRLLLSELRRSHRAWGLLPLEASGEELIAAIYALAEGLVVAPPTLIEPLLDLSQLTPPEAEERSSEPLTEREMQVMQLLAQGLANKQIALQLGISEHTVKFHISGIYSKLGVMNRTEAVRQGVRRGLILL